MTRKWRESVRHYCQKLLTFYYVFYSCTPALLYETTSDESRGKMIFNGALSFKTLFTIFKLLNAT